MANLNVTAQLIVVHNPADGTQHYLSRGAELPDWVDKGQVKQLRDHGYVSAPKARASARKKADEQDGDVGEQPEQ